MLLLTWFGAAAMRKTGSHRQTIIVGAAFFAFVTYVTWGRESHLFDLLWHHMPGFSSLRVWGRFNIVLVPMIALALCRAYVYFEELLQVAAADGKALLGRTAVLSIACAFVLGAQFWLASEVPVNHLWPHVAPGMGGSEPRFIAAALISIAVVFSCVFFFRMLGSRSWVRGFICAVITLACVAELYPIGARQWMFPGSIAELSLRIRPDVQ
ncbi:MAG: hypothetical protein HOI95_19440 [Chromatiales bacterium]|nr:hypothetical protein [Chromatiales bacterium]